MKINTNFFGGRLRRSLGCVVAACASFLMAWHAEAGIGDIDPVTGWSIVEPSGDSILVYVSSSLGDDANDGLSPESPKRSIDAANELVRDGYPDWILLKRGDIFPQPNLYRWKSGRSAAEPIVLTYYGEEGPRPQILLTDHLVDWNGKVRNHQAFIGLDLYRSISDPDSPDFTNDSCETAFRFISGPDGEASDVLVEDCRLRYCTLVTQGHKENGLFINNVYVRRNIIVNNWKHDSLTQHDLDSRIQGMYATMNRNFYFEENFLDHNGWSSVIADANANQYNHNLYMSTENDGEIVVRGNVMSRGAAHGLQLRSGGTAEMNAFIGNAIGMNLGFGNAPTFYTGQTYVQDNVVTDGRPQIPDDFTNPQTGALWGIWKQTIDNAEVSNNIVANLKDNRGGNMKPYNDMAANELGTGNIAWNWNKDNVPAVDPGWTDPSRNAEAYALAAGLDDFEHFIRAGTNRELGVMPFGVTAYAYVNYIREGFDKAAVSAPFTYAEGVGKGADPVEVTDVFVSPESVTLLVGDEIQLETLVLPSNTTDKSVNWSSSYESVATVDGDGLVFAVGQGSTEIVATTQSGGHFDSAIVSVNYYGSNLALRKSKEFSAYQDGADKINDALIDDENRWSAQTFPQWAEIDLGDVYDLNAIRLFPYQSRDYQYTVSVASESGGNYELIVDRSGNIEQSVAFLDEVEARGRYVLLSVTGAASYAGAWCSINELEVFGEVVVNGGAESFGKLTAPTSGQSVDGSFVGDNGEAWQFESGLRVEDGIDGATLQLGRLTSANAVAGTYRVVSALERRLERFSSYRWISFIDRICSHIEASLERLRSRESASLVTRLPGGVDSLRFAVQALPGTPQSTAEVELFIAGERQGVYAPHIEGYAAEFSVEGLGLEAATEIRFQLYGFSAAWIDLISWGESYVPVEGVSVSPKELEIGPEETAQLIASINPGNASDTSIVWYSSDPDIVSVDGHGQVTSLNGGSATVTALSTDGNFSDSATVTVVLPEIRVESFANLNASTTDQGADGSFVGDNGLVWEFTNTQLIESGIDGYTAQLRKYSGAVETTLPYGLETLRFSIRTKPGLHYKSAAIEIFVDGESQGVFLPDDSEVVKDVVIENIGSEGATIVRFDGNGWDSVWLDNISWDSAP